MNKLTNSSINEAVSTSRLYLEANGIERARVTRWALLLEELLLSYMEKDPSADFELLHKRFGKKITIKLFVSGNQYDILNDSESFIISSVVRKMDNPPGYSYGKDGNTVVYREEVKFKSLVGLSFVWQYMKKDVKRLVAVLIVQLLLVGLGIAIPLITAKQIVSITENQIQSIIIASIAVMLSFAVTYCLEYLDKHTFINIYNSLLKNVETDVAGRVMHLKKSCIDEYGSGIFVRRLTTDVENLSLGIGEMLSATIAVIVSAGSIVACMVICFPVGLVLLISTLIILVMEFARFKMKADDDRCYRKSSETYTALINEMVSANLDIKTLHAENRCIEGITRSIEDANDKRSLIEENSQRKILGRKLAKELMDFIYVAVIVLMMVKGNLLPAVAIVLINLRSNCDDFGYFLSVCLDSANNVAVSGERVSHLTADRDFPVEQFGTKHLPQFSGNIEFENVSFSYPGRKQPVLKDISFSVRPNENIAIAGKSGSGKTTILYLIDKLYSVDSGRLMLDGCNIEDLDEDSIRGNISMVTQSPVLFNTSIRENLLKAGNEISEEEMIDACRRSCIYDDIMNMPDGFDTVIGERGVDLSGGQKQRLAIARCILRKTKMLLLDEATSALDNNTQDLVIKAIENIGTGCTVITVAHRLSTVVHSDRIIFLSEGKIVDSGKHEELLTRCSSYKEMCNEL